MLKEAGPQDLPRAVSNSPQEREQKGDQGHYREQKDDPEVESALLYVGLPKGLRRCSEIMILQKIRELIPCLTREQRLFLPFLEPCPAYPLAQKRKPSQTHRSAHAAIAAAATGSSVLMGVFST